MFPMAKEQDVCGIMGNYANVLDIISEKRAIFKHSRLKGKKVDGSAVRKTNKNILCVEQKKGDNSRPIPQEVSVTGDIIFIS